MSGREAVHKRHGSKRVSHLEHEISPPQVVRLRNSRVGEFAFSRDGGWGAILANEFQRKADVILRGFSGYNTRQCKALLPYLKEDLKDANVGGIFLGANDANDPAINSQQSVPLDEYKNNLKFMVNYMKKSSCQSVFLVTPPALDEDKWRGVCENEGKPCGNRSSLVAQYSSACYEAAKEMEVPCVDLHTVMLERNDWKDFLSDGLHFSEKGSAFVASHLLPTLTSLLSENSRFGSEEILPLWKDVSNVDPEKSISNWLISKQQ